MQKISLHGRPLIPAPPVSMIPDIVDFFNSISHKPIQFDSFLFVWMKIFHPSCQSLAFSAPSAYYYNKNPFRFLCRFAHRVQKGAHCHDHHGAKSRTAQSGHCGPPGVVGHRAHPFQRRSLRPHHGSGLLQKGRKHPALRGLRRRSRPLGAGCGSGLAGQNAGLPRLRRGLFADSRRTGAGRLGSGALRHPHAHFEPVGGFTARPARPRAGPLHGF